MTDPAQIAKSLSDAQAIVKKLGVAQKRGILNLSGEWGPSGEHSAMKRLWYRDDLPMLMDHKHETDDCWALRPIGLAVRAIIEKETP